MVFWYDDDDDDVVMTQMEQSTEFKYGLLRGQFSRSNKGMQEVDSTVFANGDIVIVLSLATKSEQQHHQLQQKLAGQCT